MNYRAVVGLLLLLLAALPAPPPAAAGEKLVIGLIPEMNVFAQMERFKPLADYLSRQTGTTVTLSILSRYGNIIDSFREGALDGAFFGSFTGALAIRQLGVVPLARPVNLNGESTYCGYLYTRKDSGIRSAADLQGKRFAFVEKATTAGYVFPLAYFRENGIRNIDTFLGETYFSGSHDSALLAVLNRQADAGASKNTIFDWVRARDPRIDEEIVILAKSSHVPSNGLCVRSTLSPALQQKLKEALLHLEREPQGKEVLEKLGALRFIETTSEDYRPVLDMAQQAGIDLARYRYTND